MTTLSLDLGHFCKTIRQQVEEQGFKVVVPDRLEALDDVNQGLLRAFGHKILTGNELENAQQKIIKKVSRYISKY